MTDAPTFFLSYSHDNIDPFLHKFYTDLVNEVRTKSAGTELEAGGFRDLDKNKNTNWYHEIIDAVRVARVLVCLYTAGYFSKNRSHEFTAKELAVFLMRTGISYDTYVGSDGVRRRGIAQAPNVFPLLWHGENDLALHGLPPALIGAIRYNVITSGLPPAVGQKYLADGLLSIVRRRPTHYWTILERIAREITERALRPPPPLAWRPAIDTLPNPFWDEPPGTPLAAGAEPGAAALGPIVLNAFRVRAATAEDWAPYPGESQLAGLIDSAVQGKRLATVHAGLQMDAPGFAEQASRLLLAAAQAQTRLILFVDPSALMARGAPAVLQALLREAWLGGVIIPAASGTAEEREAERFRQALELPSERLDQLVVRGAVPDAAALRTAVAAVADEILARMTRFGAAQRSPEFSDGPTTRPRISNAPGR